MTRCSACQSSNVRETRESVEITVPGGEAAPRPGDWCLGGQVRDLSRIDPRWADLGRAELLAGAEAIARGLRAGGTFRFVRKALGLRAVELGSLLEVSPETVSRWENGHRSAEPSVWNTLADLVSDRLEGTDTTLTRLKASKGRIPRQPVRLSLGVAGAK